MPNPTSGRILSPEQSSDVRQLECRSYNACLDRAYDEKWPGFSCCRCEDYDPMSREEKRADLDGLARLVHEMHCRRSVC